MAVCPFADQKLIPHGDNDPHLDVVVGAILHVAVSEANSLYDFFAHRSGGIESHFYVTKDVDKDGYARIEQYRDTDWEADANYRANSFAQAGKTAGYVSIETEGMGEGTWTPEQLKSIKRLLTWLAKTHGFKLRKPTGPFSGGVGYHTMFGAPSDWTPVAKTCPGPQRVAQYERDLVNWMTAASKPAPEHTRVTEARTDLQNVIQKLNAAQDNSADGKPRDKALEEAIKHAEKALGSLPKR